MAVPATAAAEIDPSEDVFNQQTFNVLDGNGREVPFTTAQNLSRQFNSAGFTFDPSFETLERMRSGCGSTNAVRASRTAYMRFLPGVRGSFSITATTAYDVVLFGYRTSQPRHDRRLAEGELTTITCNDAGKGIGNELNMVIPSSVVNPNEAILIASGSSCGVGDSTKCTGAEPGGPTTLSVRFTADDGDGDGVPDTADGCPATAGEAPGGCPPADADADGIPDRWDDRCPQKRGVAPTGCPADPDNDGVAKRERRVPVRLRHQPGRLLRSRRRRRHLKLGTTSARPSPGIKSPTAARTPTADGVSDRVDKCPTTWGGNGADGCPQPTNAAAPVPLPELHRGSRRSQ